MVLSPLEKNAKKIPIAYCFKLGNTLHLVKVNPYFHIINAPTSSPTLTFESWMHQARLESASKFLIVKS